MRLTARGKAVVAAAAGAWALAALSPSQAMIALALAPTLALALALAHLRAPRLHVERRLERERFTEGETIVETLRVETRGAGAVHVEIEEPATPGLEPETPGPVAVKVSPRAPVEMTLRWSAGWWGRHQVGPTQVLVRDPLDLLEVRFERGEGKPLRVQPRPVPLGRYAARAGNPEPALGVHNVTRPGDGSEFFALREYAAGDSIRRINWKASARAGATMVNQVTRDSFARTVVFLDLREKEAIGRAPSAIVANGRAAASILAHHDRMKDHLSLILLRDKAGTASHAANPRTGELLDLLAGQEPGGDCDLADAVHAHLTLIRRRSPVYVVTSGVLDRRLADALRAIQAMEARPVLVSPRPGEALDPDARAAIAASRVEALAAARALGVPVVDWPEGKPLEVAMLEIQ